MAFLHAQDHTVSRKINQLPSFVNGKSLLCVIPSPPQLYIQERDWLEALPMTRFQIHRVLFLCMVGKKPDLERAQHGEERLSHW